MVPESHEVHDLLERLCNLVRTEARVVGAQHGLQPVQLEALRFLTQCNRYSDTPQSVTEFLGLTKGTVSQTLKVLEHKGLLRKRGDAEDKRVVHLKPTAKGLGLINQAVPSQVLSRGLSTLPCADADRIRETLRRLLRAAQHANGLKTFAPCYTCRFNQRRHGGYRCGLTQESLETEETRLLCREHQYPAEEEST